MTFTTFTFVIFLVVVFALDWTLRGKRARNAMLFAASYFFYGWWDWRFCSLMLGTSLLDHAVARALMRAERPAARRGLLLVSLVSNLGMLGFFKYMNFFAGNFVGAASALGFTVTPFEVDVVLPVGISFYTFQSLSYTIDVYRRQLAAADRTLDFLTFVAFFPQLVAGPIERATHLLPQMQKERTFDYEAARDGCRQMLWGFFKKMVVADNLAPVVSQFYANPADHGGAGLALATVCFAFQIYCDFSAYSDIAVGAARLFGVDIMRNFAYPYFSQDVSEFWRRWHISLSTWFRDYLFVPLGGSRVPRGRRTFNVLATFVVSGLWHGASWNYVIWGALNGLAMLPSLFGMGSRRGPGDVPDPGRRLPTAATLARIVATFAFINLTWVFFRAATFSDACTILGRIATTTFSAESFHDLARVFRDSDAVRALAFTAVLVGFEWVRRHRPHPLYFSQARPRWLRWLVYSVIFWTIMYVGTKERGQVFIYFQF